MEDRGPVGTEEFCAVGGVQKALAGSRFLLVKLAYSLLLRSVQRGFLPSKLQKKKKKMERKEHAREVL